MAHRAEGWNTEEWNRLSSPAFPPATLIGALWLVENKDSALADQSEGRQLTVYFIDVHQMTKLLKGFSGTHIWKKFEFASVVDRQKNLI